MESVWILPGLVFFSSLLLTWVLREVLLHFLKQRAGKTGNRLDNLIFASLRIPSLFWVFILAILAVLRVPEATGFSKRFFHFADQLLLSLLVVSLTITAVRLVSNLIQYYSARQHGGETWPVTGLTQAATRWTLILIGFVLLLNVLGFNIAPVLTALGISGLAVALALQVTLSNFFSGLAIALSGQIRLGQRIRLDSGQEGYVIDIGWQTTILRSPANSLIIIPNSKMNQSIVTNDSVPEEPVNITLKVGVGYQADPSHVEKILQEEGRKAIEELPGFVKSFDPVVRLQEFGASTLNFLVILQVENFDAQFPVWGELNKRIFDRLKREKIPIP